MKTKNFWGMTTLLGGALLISGSGARAQNTTGTPGRLAVVEIRDATLFDAVNLVFRSAGIPLPILDEERMKAVAVPDIVLNNVAWDDVVRQLAPRGEWRFYKGVTGQYIIEPRAPQLVPGQEGAPFAAPGSFPGAVPSNPFGGGFTRRRTQAAPLVRPGVETQANSQTRPRVPGAGRAGAGAGGRATTEPLQYRIVSVTHIYAGGIATLFGGSVIPTEQFVSPESASSNGGGGGGRGSVGVTNAGGGGLGNSGGGLGGGGIGGGGIGGGLGGGLGR